ncbi:MAG TPA: hypothetical protein GXZ77_09310 [Papillibacter sp.]|nr:hypothetical protein [Papillibacter sp.]
MPRIHFFPLCCALLLILLAGCGKVVTGPAPESPSPTPVEEPSPGDETSEKPDAAHAYFLVFEHLYDTDPGLNEGITYLAVDLSSVLCVDTDAIAQLFEDYCRDNNLTLLLDTYAGLVDKGYITNHAFEDGLFLRYDDESLTADCLVTSAQKWRSGDGADGALYTVTLESSGWEITKTAGMWIS